MTSKIICLLCKPTAHQKTRKVFIFKNNKEFMKHLKERHRMGLCVRPGKWGKPKKRKYKTAICKCGNLKCESSKRCNQCFGRKPYGSLSRNVRLKESLKND